MKKIIIFIPGIFQKISDIEFPNDSVGDAHSIYTYSYPKLNAINLGYSDILTDFNAKIKDIIDKNTFLYVVTYSSGSELFLRSDYVNEVEKIVFLSPSVFIKQEISKTLKPDSVNPELLCINEKLSISKKLACDLDQLTTEKLHQPDPKKWKVFVAEDDTDSHIWKTEIIKLNHGHEYSPSDFRDAIKRSIAFFNQE